MRSQPSFQIRNQTFETPPAEPGLYLVSTPIGNLRDITIRALETLAGCDLIACEDTRVTAKLLNHYSISAKTLAYHEHNAKKTGAFLLDELQAGKSVALVSDAGTPLVSDPGFSLVEATREAGINIWPIPGPTAPVTALVASGLSAEQFLFNGFLASKQKARLSQLEKLSQLQSTLLFFESPNRLAATLADMSTIFGSETRAVVARELTKLHEEFAAGTLAELVEKFAKANVKGEIVIIVENTAVSEEIDIDQLLSELLETMPVSKAAAEAVALTGLSKRDLYQRALAIKEQ